MTNKKNILLGVFFITSISYLVIFMIMILSYLSTFIGNWSLLAMPPLLGILFLIIGFMCEKLLKD